jgi:hypothetical protein
MVMFYSGGVTTSGAESHDSATELVEGITPPGRPEPLEDSPGLGHAIILDMPQSEFK